MTAKNVMLYYLSRSGGVSGLQSGLPTSINEMSSLAEWMLTKAGFSSKIDFDISEDLGFGFDFWQKEYHDMSQKLAKKPAPATPDAAKNRTIAALARYYLTPPGKEKPGDLQPSKN